MGSLPLPADLHIYLCGFLDIQGLQSFSLVNKFCYTIATDDYVWGQLFSLCFGDAIFPSMVKNLKLKERSMQKLMGLKFKNLGSQIGWKKIFLQQVYAALIRIISSEFNTLEAFLDRFYMFHPDTLLIKEKTLLSYYICTIQRISNGALLIWRGADINLVKPTTAMQLYFVDYFRNYQQFVRKTYETATEKVVPSVYINWELKLHGGYMPDISFDGPIGYIDCIDNKGLTMYEKLHAYSWNKALQVLLVKHGANTSIKKPSFH